MGLLGFMSKDDNHSLERMGDIFFPKEGIVWFLESTESGKWIAIYDNLTSEEELTNNPLEARSFKTKMEAVTHSVNYLPDGHKFIATEHEFVD